jgi:hypothetical protein
LLFAQAGLNYHPPTSASYRYASPHPTNWLRWVLINCLHRLALNCDPPDLQFLSS